MYRWSVIRKKGHLWKGRNCYEYDNQAKFLRQTLSCLHILGTFYFQVDPSWLWLSPFPHFMLVFIQPLQNPLDHPLGIFLLPPNMRSTRLWWLLLFSITFTSITLKLQTCKVPGNRGTGEEKILDDVRSVKELDLGGLKQICSGRLSNNSSCVSVTLSWDFVAWNYRMFKKFTVC